MERLCGSSKSAGFIGVSCLCFSVFFMFSASLAEAASCSALKSELRRLESSSATRSPATRKWSAAKKQQQNAIAAAKRDARYFDCGNSASPKCLALNDKIKRMQKNLAAIDRQLAKSGGGSKNDKRIRQIKSTLAKRNCDGAPASRHAKQNDQNTNEKPRSFLQRLFTPRENVDLAAAKTGDREISTVRSRKTTSSSNRLRLPSGGTYRTLCVRTCDGYFFPVSFSTGKRQFANDEARCSEICPAAQTELYVYRNPGGDQSKMISLAGTPYSEQPFAYKYKSEYVEGCSCRINRRSSTRSNWAELSTGSNKRVFLSDISTGVPARSLPPSRGSTFKGEVGETSPLSRTPLQKAQLPFYEDPDTLFNLEKGFNVTAALSDVKKRLINEPAQPPDEPPDPSELPLLSVPSFSKSGEAESASSVPLFKTGDSDFSQAPDRETPVRVVGPEYFVAQ